MNDARQVAHENPRAAARAAGAYAKVRRASCGAVLALVLVSACGGGGDEAVTMPDVESARLDVGLSDLERAGIAEDDVDVVGDGAFGVVDESNWEVCSQEPAAGKEVAGGKARLVVDRTCESEEAEPTAEPSAASASPSPKPSPAAPERFTMPNLVGENLQDAQDTLQAEGSYVLRQDDATGMERFQVLDSNWQVCRQSPKPGKKVPMDTEVVLKAVKVDEVCP